MPMQLREALNYLAAENLWVYEVERISLYVVGLRTILFGQIPLSSFNSSYPPPIEWLEEIISACGNIRSRLSELHVSQEHRVYEVLEAIVNHVYWLFTQSYYITPDVISEERYCDSVCRLLRELGLRDPEPRLNGSWDSDSNATKLAKEKYTQELLEFVRKNPAQVVATVYDWADRGVGHNAEISAERERVFNLFFLIESAKNYPDIDRLN
nr:hypothetical protein [Pseudomonas asplenii]